MTNRLILVSVLKIVSFCLILLLVSVVEKLNQFLALCWRGGGRKILCQLIPHWDE